MTEQDFIDNALIAVAASLATVQQPSPNECTKGTRLLSMDEVASRAANIVGHLVQQRAAMTGPFNSLHEAASEFLCATHLLSTKMGTIEQNDRWRAAEGALIATLRNEP